MAFLLLFVALGSGFTPAHGAQNPPGTSVDSTQDIFVFAKTGEAIEVELLWDGRVWEVDVFDPTGTNVYHCANSQAEPDCLRTNMAADGPVVVDQTGVWRIRYTRTSPGFAGQMNWRIDVAANASPNAAVIPGRTWVESYSINNSQNANPGADFGFFVQTREGYRYDVDFEGWAGGGATIRANGFGLVHAGTCTSTYESAEGSATGANGQWLDPAVAYSGSECGDAYKLFFEEPASDLPATAITEHGQEWIAPPVADASVSNLTLEPDAVASHPRAGDFTFDLAGVNGGYSIRVDVDNNGSYDDPVDRTIVWGSAPGHIAVPFDGLDGLGEPIGVCQDITAQVVVDRAGETHITLDDVERLRRGMQVRGATPGIAADVLLYWDDRNLTGGGSTWPDADGRAGYDASTTGQHGWTDWGDVRMIENWTYTPTSAGDETLIRGACDPELTVNKVADLDDTNGNGFADIDEEITYTFEVENTGNVELTDVVINDPRLTGITPDPLASLAPGGTHTFTADPYVVTQADVDAGGVLNSATATGSSPTGEVTSPPSQTTTNTPPRDPDLTIDKSSEFVTDANGDELAGLDDVLRYSFEVTNTGNVTLTDVAPTDPKLDAAGVTITPAAVTLAPGQSKMFTADYTVTQEDVDAGAVVNVATADGISPMGPVSSPPDENRVQGPEPDPNLTIEKSAEITTDKGTAGKADVNDVITYTFKVHNAGPATAYDVKVEDPLTGISAISPATVASIAPGDTATFTATYTVTQADVDRGTVTNRATATFLPPSDDDGTPPRRTTPPSELVVVEGPDPEPGLKIDKSAELDDVNGNGRADVGEAIAYSFDVTNTGNVSLTDVAVTDDRVTGLSPAKFDLAPGESVRVTSDPYEVIQDDVDAGEVLNTAMARGAVPGGVEVISEPDSVRVITVEANSQMKLVKSADLDDRNGNTLADAGETIRYSFTITNTGNVTLRDLSVADPMVTGLGGQIVNRLLPGESITLIADEYTVTDNDLVKGEIVNHATATGTSPEGGTVSDDDTVTTPTGQPSGAADVPGGLLPKTGTVVSIGSLVIALAVTILGVLTLASRRGQTD